MGGVLVVVVGPLYLNHNLIFAPLIFYTKACVVVTLTGRWCGVRVGRAERAEKKK